jgi:hypothetical protein
MSEFLEINEQQERATEAAHKKDVFVSRVSILVAILAVVMAATSSLENTETAATITGFSRAVLAQDRATDQWNFYEAKSLKKNIFDVAAAQAGPKADDYAQKSAHEAADEKQAQTTAKSFETQRDQALESSELHEHRHHRLAIAATLLEIGIAISTIAIITRRHWPWAMAALLGLGGLVVAVSAFVG